MSHNSFDSDGVEYSAGPLDRDRWWRAFEVLVREFEARTGELFAYCDFKNECFEVHMYRECDFHHRRTGLRVRWYEYPFRACWASREVTDDELETIVSECVLSLRQNSRG